MGRIRVRSGLLASELDVLREDPDGLEADVAALVAAWDGSSVVWTGTREGLLVSIVAFGNRADELASERATPPDERRVYATIARVCANLCDTL